MQRAARSGKRLQERHVSPAGALGRRPPPPMKNFRPFAAHLEGPHGSQPRHRRGSVCGQVAYAPLFLPRSRSKPTESFHARAGAKDVLAER